MLSRLFRNLKQRIDLRRVLLCALLLGIVFGLCLYIVQVLAFAFSDAFHGAVSFRNVLDYTSVHGIQWTAVKVLGIIFAILFVLALVKSRENLTPDERKFKYMNRKSGVYGTAGLLNEEELKGIAEVLPPDRAEGAILGQMDSSGKRLIIGLNESRYNKHVAVFGASSAGKTVSYVEPNIIQCVKRRESIVLTDPKGELYSESVAYLKAHGYEIRRFDLVNLEMSDGWDCMGEILDFGSGRLNNRTQIFASTVMSNMGIDKSKDTFYQPKLALLQACLLRVALGPDYEGRRTFSEVFHLINTNGQDLDAVFTVYAQDHPEIQPAVIAYNSFKCASPNMLGNVIVGVNNSIEILKDPLVAKITGTKRIDMTMLGKKPCAYFLVLSDRDHTYQFLSSLFFSFCFMDLMDYADSLPDRKLPVPVNFLLDEVKNVGVIPNLDQYIATVRSRRISISLILQSLDQLQQMYPDTWASIMGNCATQIGLGINDHNTARYFSERSGEATVQVRTEQHPAYESVFHFFNNSSTGAGKRSVFTVDELERLGVDDEIIVFQGRNVMKAMKYPVMLHPEYKQWAPVDVFQERPPSTDPEALERWYAQEDARVAAFAPSGAKKHTPEVNSAQKAKRAAAAIRDAWKEKPIRGKPVAKSKGKKLRHANKVVDVEEFQNIPFEAEDPEIIQIDDANFSMAFSEVAETVEERPKEAAPDKEKPRSPAEKAAEETRVPSPWQDTAQVEEERTSIVPSVSPTKLPGGGNSPQEKKQQFQSAKFRRGTVRVVDDENAGEKTKEKASQRPRGSTSHDPREGKGDQDKKKKTPMSEAEREAIKNGLFW